MTQISESPLPPPFLVCRASKMINSFPILILPFCLLCVSCMVTMLAPVLFSSLFKLFNFSFFIPVLFVDKIFILLLYLLITWYALLFTPPLLILLLCFFLFEFKFFTFFWIYWFYGFGYFLHPPPLVPPLVLVPPHHLIPPPTGVVENPLTNACRGNWESCRISCKICMFPDPAECLNVGSWRYLGSWWVLGSWWKQSKRKNVKNVKMIKRVKKQKCKWNCITGQNAKLWTRSKRINVKTVKNNKNDQNTKKLKCKKIEDCPNEKMWRRSKCKNGKTVKTKKGKTVKFIKTG